MKVDDAREGLDIQSLYPEELKTKLQAMGEKTFPGRAAFRMASPETGRDLSGDDESAGGSPGKTVEGRTADGSGACGYAGIQDRRHPEIPVPAAGWKCN